MQKTGRNDPCPCGSGKKFKKCCEPKMIRGKFLATKLDTTQAIPQSRLTGLFRARIEGDMPSMDSLKSRVTKTPMTKEESHKKDHD